MSVRLSPGFENVRAPAALPGDIQPMFTEAISKATACLSNVDNSGTFTALNAITTG